MNEKKSFGVIRGQSCVVSDEKAENAYHHLKKVFFNFLKINLSEDKHENNCWCSFSDELYAKKA